MPALGTIQFIYDDLAAGRLLRPFDATVRTARSYYLLTERNTAFSSAVRHVYDWLKRRVG